MAATENNFLQDFHWLMDVLHNIDVGLVILDDEFKIQLWNSFMQNHSALLADDVIGEDLFERFPELPEAWFRRKVQTVYALRNSAFTTWEQRPYLFRFKNYRPITGIAEHMYQNSTIIPLNDTRGNIEYICVIIYDVTEIAVNKLELEAANNRLHELSRSDGLTGLLNRKTWETELTTEYQRYQRYGHACTLIMFDIDHFKRVNDTYGHPAGDEVIRQTAAVLKDNLRNIDIAGRYGGEEFAVILVDTDAQSAFTVAERLRLEIEAHTIHYEEHVINYTISLGIAEINTQMADTTTWIDWADKGLYQAKRAGRNRSIINESSK